MDMVYAESFGEVDLHDARWEPSHIYHQGSAYAFPTSLAEKQKGGSRIRREAGYYGANFSVIEALLLLRP